MADNYDIVLSFKYRERPMAIHQNATIIAGKLARIRFRNTEGAPIDNLTDIVFRMGDIEVDMASTQTAAVDENQFNVVLLPWDTADLGGKTIRYRVIGEEGGFRYPLAKGQIKVLKSKF